MPALGPAPALSAATATLLPPPEQEEFTLAADHDLFSALPEGERTGWASLSVLAGACGGCRTVPVAADIREFVRGWLNDPGYRSSVLDPRVTHLGFALQPDGAGRKITVLVLGRQR